MLFISAAAIMAVTPGLDTAVVIRTFTAEGKKEAFKAALGINTGCLLWGIAVAFGLGAIIAVSELAYDIIKISGAVYLLWLGLGLIFKKRNTSDESDLDKAKGINWYMKGLLSNILNPKVGVFYLSFLPQFIPAGENYIVWTLGLVSIHICITMIWFTMLIEMMKPLSSFLKSPRTIKWMDKITGTVFIAFAAKLGLSR
jgi:threonine/homoserine/homoserine lactone efflux protein